MKKQFFVAGLGRFGIAVAKTLEQKGHEVLGVDINQQTVEDFSDKLTHIACADASDERVLRSLEVEDFDVAIVAIGDIQASIMITLLLKEMGVKQVVVKVKNEMHMKVIEKLGADKIVFPEQEMGERLATSLTSVGVLDLIEVSDAYSVLEIHVPHKWVGKTLAQLDFRKSYGCNIIAIRDANGVMNINPMGTDVLEEGFDILIIGNEENIARIERKITG